jgi:hypothetical protein
VSRFRTLSICLLAVGTAVGLAACSSSDNKDTTTTTVKESTTTTTAESAATIRFDKTIQQELADVGCYPGEVDGIIGAKTDAAILEFQKYAGLTADGELGPATETALKEAAAKGETVCNSNTTTTKPATTTTKPAGSPCTATALLEGIGGDPSTTITSFVCADGYAAGTLGDGSTKFILVATDGSWERPAQDPCGSASAGLPPVILQDGCPS